MSEVVPAVARLMNIQNLNGCEMIAMVGRAVSVEVVKNSAIVGNIYTIDPESRSVVLIQYDTNTSTNEKKPSHLVIVPGGSISAIRYLSDDNERDNEGTSTFGVELNTTKAKMDLARILNKGSEPENDSNAEKRCNQIIEFLQKNKVPFTQSTNGDGHKLLQVGAVRISYPYNTKAVVSNNVNAMKKMIMHLKNILEN